jgi:hypothetical protein
MSRGTKLGKADGLIYLGLYFYISTPLASTISTTLTYSSRFMTRRLEAEESRMAMYYGISATFGFDAQAGMSRKGR